MPLAVSHAAEEVTEEAPPEDAADHTAQAEEEASIFWQDIPDDPFDGHEDVFGHAGLGFDQEEEDQTAIKILTQLEQQEQPAEEDPEDEVQRAMQEMTARRRLRQKTKDVNRRSFASIVMGRQPLHSSHRLHYKRGVVWCWHCAGYGTQAPKKLIKPCTGELTRGGNEYLRNLARGLTPRKDLQWPFPVGVGHLDGPVGA